MVTFAGTAHHFTAAGGADVEGLAAVATAPLSVILQVTKRCNFDCNFCSETLQLPDPTLVELDEIRANLAGVRRVFLSGGEPLLRRDFIDIVDMYSEFIVGVPTNATRGVRLAKQLAGKVAFVNVGLEGPRSTTNRVRGDYDQVLAGIYAFLEYGLPLSLSSVVLRSTLHALPFTYQLADAFSAGKLKLILPLRKGNGLELADHEFIGLDEAEQTFAELSRLRAVHDWRPALRMTAWTAQTEGHMILVEPTGHTSAWPVYDGPDLLLPLGNVRTEPIGEIWARYPYKVNQFTSDLATLANAAQAPPPSVAAARAAWLGRHHDAEPHRIVDTRYDTGHVLGCASRRLVDVCTDLGLDVTQPELRGSMTAMHRAWLEHGDCELRERISVLNLRHSLSAALVALRAGGQGRWTGTLNVNRLLADGLAGRFNWLHSPTFQQLAGARR